MKKVSVYCIVLIMMVSLTFACAESSKSVAVSDSGVKKISVEVPANNDGLTSEQVNISQRLQDDNKIGANKFLYVISAFSGDTILFSSVKGKVTSSSKRLNPYHVTSINGESALWVDKGHGGMRVDINGNTYYTSEVLQDDGTYGHSIPYLYWWDTKGVFHKHYVSGGQIIHISDRPLVVGKVIINSDSSPSNN